MYTKLNQLKEGDTKDLETLLSEDERVLVSWTVQDNSDTSTARHSGKKRKNRLTQQSSWSVSKKVSAKRKKRKSTNTAAEWDVTPRNYRYPTPPLRRRGTSPSWPVLC